MLTRRETLKVTAAIAVTLAIPAALVPEAVTAEERALLARLPARATATARAYVLAGLRDPNPIMRRATRLVLALTPEQARRLIPWMEAEMAGAPEHELAILRKRFERAFDSPVGSTAGRGVR